MAGDDYYGDVDAGRDFPRNDNWATKNTMKIHESISHQDLSSPHKSSSGDVHEGGPSTAKNLEDEGGAVKRLRYGSRYEAQKKPLGNESESKVTEKTEGQRQGGYSVATTDFGGTTASATAATSVKGEEVQGHGQSQGHGSVPEFHGKFFFALRLSASVNTFL